MELMNNQNKRKEMCLSGYKRSKEKEKEKETKNEKNCPYIMKYVKIQSFFNEYKRQKILKSSTITIKVVPEIAK